MKLKCLGGENPKVVSDECAVLMEETPYMEQLGVEAIG